MKNKKKPMRCYIVFKGSHLPNSKPAYCQTHKREWGKCWDECDKENADKK